MKRRIFKLVIGCLFILGLYQYHEYKADLIVHNQINQMRSGIIGCCGAVAENKKPDQFVIWQVRRASSGLLFQVQKKYDGKFPAYDDPGANYLYGLASYMLWVEFGSWTEKDWLSFVDMTIPLVDLDTVGYRDTDELIDELNKYFIDKPIPEEFQKFL